MGLLDTLAADAVGTFITDFGESIVYTPKGNAPQTILAIINRNSARALQGLAGAAAYEHEIMIANDATAGRTVINLRNDTVTLSNKVNGTVETFIVMEIIQQDQGIFHLGIG